MPIKTTFNIRPGSKGEKKHSRCYASVDPDFPIATIYVKRPYSNKVDSLVLVLATASEAKASTGDK